AVHQVGAPDENLRLAAADEREDARVFEVAPEYRSHADVLAQVLDSRPEPADPADDEVNRNAALARPLQGVDNLLVDDRIYLDADARRQTSLGVHRLRLAALQQALAQVT